jgi:hypothetical protein
VVRSRPKNADIGKTAAKFSFSNSVKLNVDFGPIDAAVSFPGANANKITGKLTVSIVSVNGRDAKNADKEGYMSISRMINFTALNFSVRRRQYGGIEIQEYKGTSKNVVVPANRPAVRYPHWGLCICPQSPQGICGDWTTTAVTELTSVTMPANVENFRGMVLWLLRALHDGLYGFPQKGRNLRVQELHAGLSQ